MAAILKPKRTMRGVDKGVNPTNFSSENPRDWKGYSKVLWTLFKRKAFWYKMTGEIVKGDGCDEDEWCEINSQAAKEGKEGKLA